MPEPTVPIACTLPTDERGARLHELHELLGRHLVAVRRQPRRLTLILAAPPGPGGIEAAARDLLAREQECCAFFAFSFRRHGDELAVDVDVPGDAEAALDGLQALAARAAPHAGAKPSAGGVAGTR